MDFESPDVERDFPGLYASEHGKKIPDSDYSDEEKLSKKDLLIGKRKDKKDSKKDKGYMAFEGESSDEATDDTKSPGKIKKSKTPFKFPGKDKKDKSSKSKDVKKHEEESKKESKKKSKKESSGTKGRLGKLKKKKHKEEEKPLFGVPLSVACERSKSQDGIELPAFFRECIDYIEEHGLSCEGIYRISGVKSKVQQLRGKYDHGERVYLYEHEPHTVASLLKQFLRDLPENILTQDLKPKFEEAAAMREEGRKAETLKKLLASLPVCNRLLLSWFFVHMLHVIQLERCNKMTVQNVTIMLGPTMQISQPVLQAFFVHKDFLFQDTVIKKYVSPLQPETSRLSLELPDTPAAIEEELGQQENFLNQLHAELNAGLRDKQKEEQLWEVQRVVTQLKRKLRFLRQQSTGKPLSESSTGGEPTCGSLDDGVMDLRMKYQPPPSMTVTDNRSKESTWQGPTLSPPQARTQEVTTVLVSKAAVEVSKDEQAAGTDKQKTEQDDEVNVPTKTPTSVAPADVNTFPASFPHSGDSTNELSKESTSQGSVQSLQGSVAFSDSSLQSDPAIPNKTSQDNSNTKAVLEDPSWVQVTVIEDPDPEIEALHKEEKLLQLQQEELEALNRELRRKLATERMEISRLKGDIAECQQIFKYKQYSFDSSENSSESGSSESQDEDDAEDDQEDEDLVRVLQGLMHENQELEVKNADLSRQIHQEREACMMIKVQIKMLQQSQRPTKL